MLWVVSVLELLRRQPTSACTVGSSVGQVLGGSVGSLSGAERKGPLDSLRAFVLRLVNLGVGTAADPSEARRIRVINAVAAISILVNLLFIIMQAVAIAFGGLSSSEMGGLVIANGVSLVVAIAVLLINRGGQVDLAMWMLFAGALGNTVVAAVFLGSEVHGEMFLLVLPAFAVLITRPGDRRTQLILLSTVVIAFTAVTTAGIESPAGLVNSPLSPWLLLAASAMVVLFIGAIALYFRDIVDTAEAELQAEKALSEQLLLNILPEQTADRLKAGETVIADRAESVSVLFADLVDSTPMAESLPPRRLVELLNSIFTPFDELADELGVEKIKTMGDAYMVVAGLPVPREDHLEAIAEMALRMRDELEAHDYPEVGRLRMRFGMDTGSVVAGVIGKRKFSYDLWGNTVVTAARMESHGVPGRIQVTDKVRDALETTYLFETRGPVDIKGRGLMTTHFLERRRTPQAQDVT
jgi:adenylate cyclase